MNATQCLEETNCRLHNTLQSCVSLFREGEDNRALDALLDSIEDLERILDIFQCAEATDFGLDNILWGYRKLLKCMQNQDVTGMTDLLEFTIIPQLKAWEARCNVICR
ncbi:hypothetical protein ACS3UN_09610 [Oscillospiraceae bacterium LTW-04]|nr:hypothetical protein RBH76_11370 [Oscillospiraceae bacterium MB24-C1]